MAEMLASGLGIGVFAVGVQMLVLIAVYGAASKKEVRVYAVAVVLAIGVMMGMVLLDPLVLSRWHIDDLAVMAMCG